MDFNKVGQGPNGVQPGGRKLSDEEQLKRLEQDKADVDSALAKGLSGENKPKWSEKSKMEKFLEKKQELGEKMSDLNERINDLGERKALTNEIIETDKKLKEAEDAAKSEPKSEIPKFSSNIEVPKWGK